MTAEEAHQLKTRLDQLADDTGRLVRRIDPDSSLRHNAERIACHVQALYGFVDPTAAQLVAWYAPGDDTAIVEAIRIVDDRARSLRCRLGLEATL